MAKFIKSIFYNPDRRRNSKGTEDCSEQPTPDASGRSLARNLSISRSGRMRQANKKRHSLSPELYGEDYQQEKPKSKEYHVNPIMHTDLPSKQVPTNTKELPSKATGLPASTRDLPSKDTGLPKDVTESPKNAVVSSANSKELPANRKPETPKTPEEEIDSAFGILDKT